MNELPNANFIDIGLLLFDYRTRYRVEGNSMLPLLKEGDQVVVDENAKKFEIGDIVIAAHPFKKNVEMIKRVESIGEDGRYFLTGDNKDESSDSRTFGAVSVEYIKGKVISRLR